MVTDLTEAKSSEDNLRNFYRRWAAFMDAPSWDDLAGWRNEEQAKAYAATEERQPVPLG
jgi:hypothetical protein